MYVVRMRNGGGGNHAGGKLRDISLYLSHSAFGIADVASLRLAARSGISCTLYTAARKTQLWFAGVRVWCYPVHRATLDPRSTLPAPAGVILTPAHYLLSLGRRDNVVSHYHSLYGVPLFWTIYL